MLELLTFARDFFSYRCLQVQLRYKILAVVSENEIRRCGGKFSR